MSLKRYFLLACGIGLILLAGIKIFEGDILEGVLDAVIGIFAVIIHSKDTDSNA